MTREELCICACKYAIEELTKKGSCLFITSRHDNRQQISWVDVVEWLKTLEYESVLEKIRAEIEQEQIGYPPCADYYKAIVKCLQIIDDIKSESEVEE